MRRTAHPVKKPKSTMMISATALSPALHHPSLPPNSKTSNANRSTESDADLLTAAALSRRRTALIALLTLAPSSLSLPAPATAFSFGISGPKDWLKDQKRKTARFILAPIDASREILQSAYRLLTAASESEYTSKDLEEIRGTLRSAARDCVVKERNSFVEFQANTGVEVCTFQLIVKNASSLLGKNDPVKLETEAILDDLIRSFSSLNNVANEADIQVASDRLKVADALKDTILSLNKFEQGVKNCLEA